MRVVVVPGGGRAHRSDHVVAFSMQPMPELAAVLLDADDDQVFKQLAGLVVSSDFSCDPFLVARLGDAPKLFIFGNLVAALDDEIIDAASADTWVDRKLPIDFNLTVGDTTSIGDYVDCVLQEGTVAAAGLRLSTAETTTSRIPQTSTSVAEPADADIGADVVQDESSGNAIEQAIEPALTTEEEHAPFTPDDDEDDFDPFADPESVDLEAIGTSVPSEELVPSVDELPPTEDEDRSVDSPPDENTFDPDVTIAPDSEAIVPEQPPQSQPAGLRPPPTQLPPPTASGATPPLGIRPPPSALEPIVPLGEPIGEPIERPAGTPRLRIDDGQVIDIGIGVYVGRYPSKKGLPDGFGEVAVQGEGISRVHWAIVEESSGAFAVEDLGSTGGTGTIGSDGTEQDLRSGARRIIGPGTRITFGDRWAVFER